MGIHSRPVLKNKNKTDSRILGIQRQLVNYAVKREFEQVKQQYHKLLTEEQKWARTRHDRASIARIQNLEKSLDRTIKNASERVTIRLSSGVYPSPSFGTRLYKPTSRQRTISVKTGQKL